MPLLVIMARSQPTRSRSSRPVADRSLSVRLRQVLSKAPADRPLPTTRQLGQNFDVANTTVHRVLRDFALTGEIWQHPTSGRYYPATARALLERPKPIACLIRRLELGSELYREILEGISSGCGERRRTMLLWHDELLLNHPNPNEPPVFSPVLQQRAILDGFLNRHGESAGGFLLDHVWSDDTLNSHAARLKPAVVLFRTCQLAGCSNIHADFRAGALKALAHLLGRGYEHIIPVAPFAGDPAVAEFFSALEVAAKELNCRQRMLPVARASTATERRSLIERMRRKARRTALLCPEDNVAVLLHGAAREAGLRLPERMGLLSVMGTDFATKAGISCLCYDFRALGRMAVEAINEGTIVQRALEPQFFSGATT